MLDIEKVYGEVDEEAALYELEPNGYYLKMNGKAPELGRNSFTTRDFFANIEEIPVSVKDGCTLQI